MRIIFSVDVCKWVDSQTLHSNVLRFEVMDFPGTPHKQEFIQLTDFDKSAETLREVSDGPFKMWFIITDTIWCKDRKGIFLDVRLTKCGTAGSKNVDPETTTILQNIYNKRLKQASSA